jgi:hypothetical protein
MLPGRRDDGAATCRDCAGITRDFTCARCGREALLLDGRLCERCTLEQPLMAILGDGTGQVRPPMRALADTVLSTVRPTSALQWLRDPRVPELLSGLATGTIPLTHEALGTWLARDDFARLIHQGTGTAAIDWEAAVSALHAGELPSSGGERRILLLPASLAGRAPVSLGDAITGIDDSNVGLLVKAVLHASGRRQFPR